jgi:hypothetical protein
MGLIDDPGCLKAVVTLKAPEGSAKKSTEPTMASIFAVDGLVTNTAPLVTLRIFIFSSSSEECFQLLPVTLDRWRFHSQPPSINLMDAILFFQLLL